MKQVAAIQMNSSSKIEENLDQARQLIDIAVTRGAGMVVLPENFAIMPATESQRLQAAEPEGRGEIQEFLQDQAKFHHIWVVGGTLPIKTSDPERVRSSCCVYDTEGRRVARYDKVHLFDVNLTNGESYLESAYIEPGDRSVVANTPFGSVGLTICYDVRFPELYRKLVEAGARLLLVPSAFTKSTGEAHWRVLLRARAIENQSYLVAPAQCGEHDNGRSTYGYSMIVDPWGEVIAELADGPGVIMAEIEVNRLTKIRDNFPSLSHRRSFR